jgi:hypothetical protein
MHGPRVSAIRVLAAVPGTAADAVRRTRAGGIAATAAPAAWVS